MLALHAVWSSSIGAVRLWAEDASLVGEHLLGDLGRAARFYPDLDAALDVARLVTLDLDAAGAHRFLADIVPLLEQAGFPTAAGEPGAVVPHALLLRLDDPPIEIRGRPLADVLQPAYSIITQAARHRLHGEPPSPSPA